jgi:hypothetical protein
MTDKGNTEMAPKVQTMEELEAEIKADEAAELAAQEAGQVVLENQVLPEIPITPEAPAVKEASGDEALKQQLQAANDRIAELTKRVNGEDGRRGGELNALRHQVEQLGNQLKELMAENQTLKASGVKTPEAPAATDEPDYLEKEFPEIAAGVNARNSKAMSLAEKAAKAAEEANKSLAEIHNARKQDAEGRFFTELTTAVPDWAELNTSPEFLAFCAERIKGTNLTRLQVLQANRDSLSAVPVIEVFQDYAASKAGSGEAPKAKKEKPSLESQQTLPSAGAGSSGAPKSTATRARLKELENKVFVVGSATRDERLEYERLIDADAEGKLT